MEFIYKYYKIANKQEQKIEIQTLLIYENVHEF